MIFLYTIIVYGSILTYASGFNLDALVREAKEKERGSHGQKTVPRINELTHYPSELGVNFSTPASSSTASKQELSIASPSKVSTQEREEHKTISLAQLERALSVESRRLQRLQLQRDTSDLQTHGETTPPTESTATQQRKIEVAREQLVDLTRALQQKAQQARKGKAATVSSNANTGTTAASSQAPQRSSQTKPAGLIQQTAPAQVQQRSVMPPKAPASQQQQPQQRSVFHPPPVVSCSSLDVILPTKIQQQSTQLQKLTPPFQKQSPPKPQQKPPVSLPPRQQPVQQRAEPQQTRPHQQSVLNAGDTNVSGTSQQGEQNKVTGDKREGQATKGGDQLMVSSGTWKEKALALRKKNVVNHTHLVNSQH